MYRQFLFDKYFFYPIPDIPFLFSGKNLYTWHYRILPIFYSKRSILYKNWNLASFVKEYRKFRQKETA